MLHKPVLLEETLQYLNLREGMTVVDGTLGSAGHSLAILHKIGLKGRLVALDQDPQAIERSRIVLKDFPQVSYHINNFVNLETVLDSLNIQSVDAVILDVGFSSDQLEDPGRGFSFDREGPLDMRLNPDLSVTARDLVNDLSQERLEALFRELGEEHQARKYARIICENRRKKPIETTIQLAQVILSTFPKGFWYKKHPATRIFQALRIAVNRELEVLSDALPKIWTRISPAGRLAVISFHSLEDRIVKKQFLNWQKSGNAVNLTRKPVTASAEEQKNNSRSRSAKLRAVEKKV